MGRAKDIRRGNYVSLYVDPQAERAQFDWIDDDRENELSSRASWRTHGGLRPGI